MWYGFNRRDIDRRAPKPLGGVGILIKTYIYDTFNVSLVDKTYDGIIGLKLEHKTTERSYIVFSCYLPPENSTRGRDSQGFFSHLLAQTYLFRESDTIIVAGDFNAKTGNIRDDIADIDSFPATLNVDATVNQHGHCLPEFLNESKMCVLNGTFLGSDKTFTSVSRKGRAVVDYFCVPHDNY